MHDADLIYRDLQMRKKHEKDTVTTTVQKKSQNDDAFDVNNGQNAF